MAESPARSGSILRALSALLVRVEGSWIWELIVVFRRIDGRDRVMMLAGQAFIAMFPVLIVGATIASSDGRAVADQLVDQFDLQGSSAEAMRLLFGRPPGGSHGLTLVSAVVLLWSFTSFARAMQRTFETAWQLPRRGARGVLSSSAGVMVLIAFPSLGGWIGSLFAHSPFGVLVSVVLQAATVIGGWALVSWFMLSRRRPLPEMLPGALFSAGTQLLIGWWTALYVPSLIAHNSERYGVIGVALALISWLIIVAAGIVSSAVCGPVILDWWRGRSADGHRRKAVRCDSEPKDEWP